MFKMGNLAMNSFLTPGNRNFVSLSQMSNKSTESTYFCRTIVILSLTTPILINPMRKDSITFPTFHRINLLLCSPTFESTKKMLLKPSWTLRFQKIQAMILIGQNKGKFLQWRIKVLVMQDTLFAQFPWHKAIFWWKIRI